MTALCRDCLVTWHGSGRCPACGSRRTVAEAGLTGLAIAHVDCDAFYASVEKRDDPALRDVPLIVGGGKRGVVTTACYVARIKGVKSAMPMFQALRLCPEAVVVRPRMARYAEVSRQIRARMEALTPLVEPLSLDEAFLDLSGTERLHRAPPAVLLARLQAEIERDLGITVSVGLSHNKFLAKIASEQDKPRGFYAIGPDRTRDFLAPLPVGAIWGVGPAAVAALAAEGIRTIADLRAQDRDALLRRFGTQGERLFRLARGEDARPVSPDRPVKSVSNETTFAEDLATLEALTPILWDLTETVSARLKAKGISGRTVTLKLKRADHRILTRRTALTGATRMADDIYRAALLMLHCEIPKGPFRLLGVGVSELRHSTIDQYETDLLDPNQARRLAAERAADAIRKRFGCESIGLGRSFRSG